MPHTLSMNNDAAANADEIFGSSILSDETCAMGLAMGARRLRSEGRADWAADYDRLAGDHAADARSARDRAAEHASRLDAIRAA
jgi:hypothetical protein